MAHIMWAIPVQVIGNIVNKVMWVKWHYLRMVCSPRFVISLAKACSPFSRIYRIQAARSLRKTKAKNLPIRLLWSRHSFTSHIAFCTGMYAFLYTAFANFAPWCFLVFMTAWTLSYAVFLASSAVKSAGCNHLCISYDFLHNVYSKRSKD